MTRTRFESIQSRRGYEVTSVGLTTILRSEDKKTIYTAYWFWNPDGTLDESHKPTWRLERK